MSAAEPAAGLVLRLRKARRDATQAALTASREHRLSSEEVADTRSAERRVASAGIDLARSALSAHPGEAEARLALLDRSRFEGALAAERALEAERQLAEARYEEDRARARLIQAEARHAVLDRHVQDLSRSAARLAEERESLDVEPWRRR